MNKENNDHYVYIHRRKDNNVVFYVGHGRGKRMYSGAKSKTKNWSLINNLAGGHVVEQLFTNLTKSEAEDIELNLVTNPDLTWELVNIRKPVQSYLLDYKQLSEVLEYSEDSPTFLKWKNHPRHKSLNGKDAGGVQKTGQNKTYWCVRNNGRLMLVHRVIYVLFNKVDIPKGMVIDHIDGDGLNNHIDNLRMLTQQQNSSTRKSKIGSSGVTGVYKEIKPNKQYWIAKIYSDGNAIRKSFCINNLGDSEALKLAIEARKEFELLYQPI